MCCAIMQVMTNQPTQPTLARIALGDMLRRAREAKGISPGQLAETMSYNRNSIMRIESGEQGTKPLVVEKLCQVLGIPDEQMSVMTQMVVRGKERGWWESFKDGSPHKFPLFAETEVTAKMIRTWHPEYLPGIVQTPEYLDAIQAPYLSMSDDTRQTIQGFRLKRQELLAARTDEFSALLLVSSAALRYLDSMAAEVKEGQIARLRDKAQERHFEIRVPTVAHAAMDGGFTILTPGLGPTGQERRPFAYVESLDGCRYLEDSDVVSMYEQAFENAWRGATPLKEYLG